MWQKTTRHERESNPDTPGYVKHNNSDITTTLLRITNERYLVVYISLKRTHNPKWKLFGCRMGGDLGHFRSCFARKFYFFLWRPQALFVSKSSCPNYPYRPVNLSIL